MLESEYLIQKVLDTAGEVLTFGVNTIKGLPSFSTDVLVSQEVSTYRVEQQDWNFQVSTKDCIDKNITIDNTFTMNDLSYKYTFKLNSKPISYGDGWSRLPVNLLGKTLL